MIDKIFSYHKWRQRIPLGNGVFTPGHIDKNIWKIAGLPQDMNGCSFLDVGSNDGMVVFEAETKGALKITACDLYIDELVSMTQGWPVEGIQILKEYFNSGIEINREGVYGLKNIEENYDYVLLSDVINWVGDIDEAIKILSSRTGRQLHIIDQFLTLNKGTYKGKMQSEELKVFPEMCNINYLTQKLRENGFRKITVERLAFLALERTLERYLDTYYLEIKEGGGNFYAFPKEESEIICSRKVIKIKSHYEHNGYFFIRNEGWVKGIDVKVKRNRPSLIYRAFKKMRIRRVYFRIKALFNKKETDSFVVIASK